MKEEKLDRQQNDKRNNRRVCYLGNLVKEVYKARWSDQWAMSNANQLNEIKTNN